jgi:hypothetical protein
MRRGRWIAGAVGVAAALSLVAPAGAGVRSAASDRAILKAGVLTAADVPSTWASTKQPDVGTKNYQGISDCKQISAAIDTARRGAHVFSPQFADPSSTSNALAEDTVFAFKSVKAAQRYVAAFAASTAASCYQEAFVRSSRGQGQATVAPLTDVQGLGDQAVGFQADITGTQNGQPVHAIADVVGVRVGRAFVGFNFLNNDVRLPDGVGIVQAVMGRLTTAVRG